MASAKKITPPFVRNPYNYDTNEAGDESGLDCQNAPGEKGHGRTKQSFKEEVDINTIVKRFGIGYEMPEGISIDDFRDYTDVGDFKSNMDRVANIRENFELLPAHIRARFENNPGKFHDFILAPDNRDEVKKMGLLSKEALERDQKAQEALAAENEAKILAKAEAAKSARQENTVTKDRTKDK